MIAFIGPNGAGKVHCFRLSAACWSRLLEKFISKKEIRQWRSKELAKNLAFLQQSNGFTVDMTVEELVSFGRFPYNRGRSTPEDEQIISESLTLFIFRIISATLDPCIIWWQLQRVHIWR